MTLILHELTKQSVTQAMSGMWWGNNFSMWRNTRLSDCLTGETFKYCKPFKMSGILVSYITIGWNRCSDEWKQTRKGAEVLQVSWRKVDQFLSKCYCVQGKERKEEKRKTTAERDRREGGRIRKDRVKSKRIRES